MKLNDRKIRRKPLALDMGISRGYAIMLIWLGRQPLEENP